MPHADALDRARRTSRAADLHCNLISGNSQFGLFLDDLASTTTIQGNFVGTDLDGTQDLGNGMDGMLICSQDNQIGGTTASARNVVSGQWRRRDRRG